ncbi:4a-hydroxytetrahydrobiopterin dehydratase [Sedimenticola sp.]|uniref:4a-hydroxytetrahydrobiopterin dehydratase n=1 Tax=Sedimenticola sp. TaxID=1940285 RepID=UPI003D0A18A1
MKQTSMLQEKHCRACDAQTAAISEAESREWMAQLSPEWALSGEHPFLVREFRFKNFYQTIAFVNALAWIAHGEDHHPDLEVGYNRCKVQYHTHAINGLTENDFICAAKIDALLPMLAREG